MALPAAIATTIQDRLDTWWSQHHTRPRLALVRARMAAAAPARVLRVRCFIVANPGDNLGPAIVVEIDDSIAGTVSQAFRPTVASGDVGRTINDVDQDGPTVNEGG